MVAYLRYLDTYAKQTAGRLALRERKLIVKWIEVRTVAS